MADLCRWALIKAAVKGRQHEKNGLPCQDQVVALNKAGVALIALSDGAGSRKRSKEGARVLTSKVGELIAENFEALYESPDQTTRERIAFHLLMCLEEKAIALSCDVREMSATLAFFAVKGNRFITGQIGDGIIAIKERETLSTAFRPQKGEYANATNFLDSKAAVNWLEIRKGDSSNIEGALIMSDGPAECLYDRRGGSLSPGVGQMLEWPVKNSVNLVTDALIQNIIETIRARTQDDCSIAIARRRLYSSLDFLVMPEETQREFFYDKSDGFFKRHMTLLKKYLAGETRFGSGVSHHIRFLKSYVNKGG